ncbi:hypothetical protein K443DRAFT_679405 [Laccaria amethystina LaAM-08-1]|jgi:hypothetical protein|uniref:Unplaced genomic scaffold K443scaffold_97, whole genome shotgun sequence n=1 Tax=Laccaria amethystina LaAM-08-1 TaxID=1095629 RepID=A0A0C9X538_9AGAR|nr:hypothetical protein K443DRAFT_679405 [Laccaria amethystina LaAM-08-1]
MTEYDFSPEAYDRHLATQQRIGRWVDETERYPKQNPFIPLPPDPHSPSDYVASAPPAFSPPPGPHPTYGYEYGYSQPQTAPHSAPPTRPSSAHRRHHGHSRSKGFRVYASASSSPHSNSTPLPLLHRNYRPDLVQSFPQPATASAVYPMHNGYGVASSSQPQPTSYPPQSAVSYPTQYSAYQTPQTNSYPQSTYSSGPQTPSSAYTTLPGGGTYVQPSKQPVIIPINGGTGGYVIVPPAGTYFRTADMYNVRQEPSEDQGKSFFGRLTGSLTEKKKRSKRSDSY